MLMHLRSRIETALAAANEVTIATAGPAELQITSVPCRAQGLMLFLLVPHTSDHLVNLDDAPEIAVAGPGWRLRGQAQVLEETAQGFLARSGGDRWHCVVAVQPWRFEWLHPGGDCAAETIDIDDRAGPPWERGRLVR
jgi:hypothetical protein